MIFSTRMFIAAALFLPLSGQAEAPAWVRQDAFKRTGSILTLVCRGEGPDDLARREALSKCRAAAADHANADFQVTTLSVETEKSIGFHEEVSSQKTVTGLECAVKDEYIEQKDGFFVAYLKCSFDLSKAKIVSEPAEEPAQVELGENKVLYLSSIPKCDSVIVKGSRPRTITCKANPTPIQFQPGDRSIIIRADGYQPKHLNLDGGEFLHVLLKRN